MKKIFYSLVALLAFSCSLVSCSDDDDNGISFSTTAEKGAAGTYTGTWKQTEDGTTETTTCEGTITLTATDSLNCVDVTFSAPDFEISATSVANIAHAQHGYVLNNNVDTNPLAAAFTGKIDENGNLSVNFMKQRRVGRKQYTFFFVFEGKKN